VQVGLQHEVVQQGVEQDVVQLLQQSSQQSHLRNRARIRCNKPGWQQQSQLSQQDEPHELQLPPQQAPLIGADDNTGAAGAGSAPASQAVVSSKKAAFTIDPPFRNLIGFGTRPRWPGTTRPG
jgi:hypothetical protein